MKNSGLTDTTFLRKNNMINSHEIKKFKEIIRYNETKRLEKELRAFLNRD